MAAADETTENFAEVMNAALADAARADAEANRLKRKYEPQPTEIVMDKILKLTGDNISTFMRVTVRTSGKLELLLIPQARGRIDSFHFVPTHGPSRSFCDQYEEFDRYGVWQISIGDGCACHDWLVHFDHKGVRITVVTDHNGEYMVGPDTTTIKEYTAPVTWTSSDDA